MRALRGAWLAACLAAGGCAAPPPASIVHQPMTVRARVPLDTSPGNGAIYQALPVGHRPLFEDLRARNVGDTLTIVIAEKTAATKKGSSKLARKSDLAADVGVLNHVPGQTLQGLSAGASTSNSFNGAGEASSGNDFTGSLAVTVTEVLPNGYLLVSGEKQIAMTQGTEYIRFSGVVNPRMILAGNTVSSTQVADARIEYKANGYLDEAHVMGWLGRFFMSVLPF